VESRGAAAGADSQGTGVPAQTSPGIIPDESITFRWFVEERYLPMREGTWSPAYRKINTFEIKHYLVVHFGRIPFSQIGTFEIQSLAQQARNPVFAIGGTTLLHQHPFHYAVGKEAEISDNGSRGRPKLASDQTCRSGGSDRLPGSWISQSASSRFR
jgi:hypothetical protein